MDLSYSYDVFFENEESDDNKQQQEVETDSDELLISLVKTYAHLFDKNNPNFKNALMKQNSWKEISEVMNVPVTECQKRWVRLREKFGREKKKIRCIPTGTEGGYKPSWALYNSMEFLEKHVNTRKRFSNINNKTKSKVDDESDKQSSASETSQACYSGGVKKKKQDVIDVSFIELSSAIKNHLSHLSANEAKPSSEDADELFCKFLVAELKKKSEETKNKLKKQLVSLVMSVD